MKLRMPHKDCPKEGGIFVLMIAKPPKATIYVCDKCGERIEEEGASPQQKTQKPFM